MKWYVHLVVGVNIHTEEEEVQEVTQRKLYGCFYNTHISKIVTHTAAACENAAVNESLLINQ